ncbi:Peptidyl-prolyl cis-trans isomerase [Aphelenchoides besseyi]|nr:Peptidyl-prolyl cis-trans isomerase [Aphelenchoides besseyi]KAI6195507.1 Peptidyl-prolyl cis-trans isomerase [Aphelenchoides besseyi]
MSVLIETTVGDIVVDLFIKERPTATRNFLKLCKSKYYNLCQFFTIQKDYIAQTGDPTNTGQGGESIFAQYLGNNARYFQEETPVKMKHRRRGMVSFVNNGSDMYGSQFFITLADELDFLDGKHCIFGVINEGLETLGALNEQIVDEFNQPYRDIRIAHTIILDDPFPDDKRLRFPSRSPSPTSDLIEIANKIALDQDVNEDADKTAEQIQREIQDRDLKTHAQILEMIGDIHDVDEKPPDNVLFVCKLNPVTTDEDLEVIFGRFGDVKSCEVIKDRRTKASLQYAFIEFATPEQCEAAYLKMDNVLIDDRRIHVDFSQSVAKTYQWKRNDQDDDVKSPNQRQPTNRREQRDEPREKRSRRNHSSSPESRRRNEDDERKRHRDDRRRSRERGDHRRRRYDSPVRERRRHDTPPRRRRRSRS